MSESTELACCECGWHVIDGELEVTVAGTTQRCGPGTVAVVAPNTQHSVLVLRAGRAIVVDHPLCDGS